MRKLLAILKALLAVWPRISHFWRTSSKMRHARRILRDGEMILQICERAGVPVKERRAIAPWIFVAYFDEIGHALPNRVDGHPLPMPPSPDGVLWGVTESAKRYSRAQTGCRIDSKLTQFHKAEKAGMGHTV